MKRFALSSFTFAVLSICYALYARVVVPRIEPPLPPLEAQHLPRAAPGGATAAAESDGPGDAREVARRGFGTDAPEAKAPFVWQFYNEQTTVYFFTEHYEEATNNTDEEEATNNTDASNHQLVLKPLSIAIRHEALPSSGAPEANAVHPGSADGPTPSGEPDIESASITTLRCPEARLQFDKLDMARLQAGKPTGGFLKGPIEILHHRVGDVLPFRLRTRDVQFEASEAAAEAPRLSTDAPVQFSHGTDSGNGQGLDIFLSASSPRTKAGGLAVSGIRSLRIRNRVRFTVLVDPKDASFSRLAGQPQRGDTASAAGKPLPLEIRSSGPFEYDFETNTASFREAVEVLHHLSPSESERIQCERLELLFARNQPAAPVRPGADGPSGLSFRRLTAVGKPVLIDSPPNNIHVLATFVSYDTETGQSVFSNDDGQVLIVEKSGETRTGHLTINLDNQGDIASVLAEGAGQFWRHDDTSAQDLRAHWGERLGIERDKGLYVLRLRGRARLQASPQELLEAEKLDVWLRPQPQDRDVAASSSAGRAVAGSNVAGMEPVKLQAEGRVHIESPQFSGNIGRLDMFEEAPPVAGAGASDPRGSASPSKPRRGPRRDGSVEGGRLHIDAQLLRVQFLRAGGEMQVSQMRAEGKIDARQVASAGNGPAGLVLRGSTLHLRDVGGNEKLRLTGSPAEVRTEEMALKGQVLYLNRAANRLDVDGAGLLVLSVDRDFDGRQLATPKQLEIRWAGDLTFDGATAVFRKAVEAKLEATRILCHQMDVVLDQPISFSDPPDDVRGSARIRKLVCKTDPALPSSRVELVKEVLEQGKLAEYQHGTNTHMVFEPGTGDVQATGPGELVSVAPGDDPGFGLGLEGPRAAAQRPASAEPGLKRLHIRYAENMSGNLNQRRVTFRDFVEVLYGPVSSAEEVLDQHRLPQDGLWMRSDALELAQEDAASGPSTPLEQPTTPTRTRTPMLMIATGNVKADVRKNGLYSTLAHRISYSQFWDRLIIEGHGSNHQAVVSRQLQPGGYPDRFVGDRITFLLRKQELKVDGGTFGEGQP